jgi:hypothetical protein
MSGFDCRSELERSIHTHLGDVPVIFIPMRPSWSDLHEALDEIPGKGVVVFQGGDPDEVRRYTRGAPRLLPPWRVREVVGSRIASYAAVVIQLQPPPDGLTRVIGTTPYSLDPDRLEQLARRVGGYELRHVHTGMAKEDRMLMGVGAAVEHYGQTVATVAGMVALGLWPGSSVDGARVRVVVGNEERWYEDSLPSMLTQVSALEVLHQGLRPEVIRELLLNAFVHRSWHPSTWSQPVEVIREGWRVLVRNPGQVADGAGPGSPVANNPVLVDLMQRVGLFSGKGKGLRTASRMVKELGGGGPEISVKDGVVRQVLQLPGGQQVRRARPEAGEKPEPVPETALGRAIAQVEPQAELPEPPIVEGQEPAAEPSQPKPSEPGAQPVSKAPSPKAGGYRTAEDRQRELCAVLEERGSLTTRELIVALGWTRATTRKVIADLVEQGTVRGQRANSQSPYQAWRLAR